MCDVRALVSKNIPVQNLCRILRDNGVSNKSELTMAARRRRLVLHHSVPLLSRLSAISLFSHAFHEGSACYGVRGLPFFPEKRLPN